MEPLATFGHVVLTQLDSPGSILIAYTIVGFLVFLVMSGLGEMAAWLPLGSGFSGYATRFCDPALGFALGYVRVTPSQILAARWLKGGNSSTAGK